MKSRLQAVLLLFLMTAGGSIAQAQTVKVTPLGGKTGELCAQDRALLFEDPTGVRILYDPGNTVAGGTDPRLGEVHAILITHAHADHLGAGKLNQSPDAGTTPPTVAAPETNLAEIASAKNSAVIAGLGLASFLSLKIANVRGAAVGGCPAAGLTNELTVPRTTPCTATLLSGGKRTVRLVTANQGVQIAVVAADHPNDLSTAFLSEPLKTNLASNNLSAYVGIANGFVLTFTNGLTAYLSGDTGLIQEMKTVVNGFYGAELAVINISDTFVTGPEEAAFAINNLVRPATVLPSHTNEVSTSGGRANPGTRLE
ncbi:MAG: metal-dependent hydrolase, partial [Acidobacteria bacterium]